MTQSVADSLTLKLREVLPFMENAATLRLQITTLQSDLAKIESQETEALGKIQALVAAGITEEGILAAMTAMYKPAGSGEVRMSKRHRSSDAEVATYAKALLATLDREGKGMGILIKETGLDRDQILLAFKSLGDQVCTEGERKGTVYKLVTPAT